MSWATSDRASRLPHDWPAIRQRVKQRARGRCEAAVHDPRCDGQGTDADHIIEGDDHSLTNLQWLSTPCHQAKTARDAAERNRLWAQLRRRPTERHPGRITA